MSTTLLDAARDLAPLIERCAADADGAPVAAEVVAALDEAGLYGAMVPRDLGGAELDIVSCLDLFAEVARADGSTGWCLMASTSAASFFGVWCPDSFVDSVFGAGIPRVAGQFAPKGSLTPDGEGWRLAGDYQFGSGMNDAAWVGAGAVTVPRSDENPSYRFVLVPRDEVVVAGNWDVLGLQGTASWDYRIDDIAVGDDATFDFFFPQRRRGGAVYDMGVLPLTSAGHAGWAIGLMRRALDELAAVAAVRRRMAGASDMRDSEWVQMRLGLLEAKAAAMSSWVYDSFARLEAQVLAADGAGADPDLVRAARMATTLVNQEGAEVIRDAYVLAGTPALRDGGLQRAFRDIHAGTQHAVVSESVTADFGRAAIARATPA